MLLSLRNLYSSEYAHLFLEYKKKVKDEDMLPNYLGLEHIKHSTFKTTNSPFLCVFNPYPFFENWVFNSRIIQQRNLNGKNIS